MLGESHELGKLLKRLGTADAVVYLGGADHLHVLVRSQQSKALKSVYRSHLGDVTLLTSKSTRFISE